jgi:ubiquinone/menaquinone biosynthesis C-methylase UbiE
MTLIMEKILELVPKSIVGRNKKVYNFSKESDSFDFYDNQFDGDNQFEIGSAVKEEDLKKSPKEMIAAVSYLRENIDIESIVVELGGSRHQRRSGFPYHFFPNYIPLDISKSSMVAFAELYDRESIACDAQKLPFRDNSIDAIYTHTFLEHPMNPDAVVKEIDRVLKVGGVVVHSDAWHCRWWKRFGVYGVKKFPEIGFSEKLLYIIIALSEVKIFRFPVIVMKRFFKELFISKSKPVDLIYGKLTPNYELKIYSDEDAAGNIDPLDLIRFYESRDYELVNKRSFIQRMKLNDQNLYFKKVK